MKKDIESEVYLSREIDCNTEGYRSYRKKEMYEEIDKTEKEVDKIYFEITNSDTISQYKKNLLLQKLMLLHSKIESMIKGINLCRDTETKFLKKKYIICVILIILNSIFLVLAPLVSLPIFFLLMTNLSSATKLISGMDKMKNEKELEEQINRLDILFHNCEMFLNKKTNKYMEHLKEGINKNNEEVMILAYANDLLGYYLIEEENIPEYSIEVKDALIKMLQDDLQTDVESLDELIELDKNKLEYQTINEEMNLGMNITTLERKREKN